jgi:hypothetical protein
MTTPAERRYQTEILRDAMAIFTAAYLSHDQVGTTPDMKVAFALIEASDEPRKVPLILALARFGADFAHFVERCAVAADASMTKLEPRFTAELLYLFSHQQEQNIGHYERTGRYHGEQ